MIGPYSGGPESGMFWGLGIFWYLVKVLFDPWMYGLGVAEL